MSWQYSDQWAAGFFDGEGNISIVKRLRSPGFIEHHLSVAITQSVRQPLDEIQRRYGGSITLDKNHGGNQPHWRLRFHGTTAGKFLLAIYPYSLVKKTEIEIALKLRSAIGVPGQRMSEANRAVKDQAYDALRLIRKGQGR